MRKALVSSVAICCILTALPVPSPGLTVDEVLYLKQQGVSDDTIQLMIQQEMQREQSCNPGRSMGVHKMVEPGGRSVTIYSTGENECRDDYGEESEREKRDKAWEMLHNIVIDTREEERDRDGKSGSRDR